VVVPDGAHAGAREAEHPADALEAIAEQVLPRAGAAARLVLIHACRASPGKGRRPAV
jgi:hypothetical protein